MSDAKRARIEEGNGGAEDTKMEALIAIQDKLEELNNQSMEEIVEIEKKYNQLKRPHFDKRAEVIREISTFWATSLKSHRMFTQLIDEKDEEVLQSLTSVNVEDNPDVKSGFTIHFEFAPNDFFENTTISKAILYEDSGVVAVQNTPINWKPGKDLTKKEVKGPGKRDEVDARSIFDWFADDTDAVLAETIREDIWPNPVKYFCGTFSDDEDAYGDDDDDDDDGDDDGDDDATGEVDLE